VIQTWSERNKPFNLSQSVCLTAHIPWQASKEVWCSKKKLKLDNVLFVPSFTCNLVSIARLCKDLNCAVTFFDNFCVLQDHTLRTRIGVGEQQGGVHYFKDGSLGADQVNAVKSSSLWHRRLGHPSSGVLSFLPNSLGVVFKRDNNQVCDICYRAKQMRNQFHVSHNKEKCVFDLIHCDIWGPYRESSFCGAHYFFTIVDDASRATWV